MNPFKWHQCTWTYDLDFDLCANTAFSDIIADAGGGVINNCSDTELNCQLSSPDHTLQNAQTALHIALESDRTKTAMLLLDHKADINTVDKV